MIETATILILKLLRIFAKVSDQYHAINLFPRNMDSGLLRTFIHCHCHQLVVKILYMTIFTEQAAQ